MAFTGRPMGGMIDVGDEALADDVKRAEWLRLSSISWAPCPPSSQAGFPGYSGRSRDPGDETWPMTMRRRFI